MNFKTTLFLAVIFLGLALGYIMYRPPAGSGPVVSDSTPAKAPDDVARSVWTDDPGEIVKIVCRRKGEDEDWVFEKQKEQDDGGQGEWRMTAPFDAPAVRWEIDGIARQLTGLNHEVSYKIGDGGGSAPYLCHKLFRSGLLDINPYGLDPRPVGRRPLFFVAPPPEDLRATFPGVRG